MKFPPEDGNPYKFPSTCSTIPFGAIIPSGVAIHSMKSLLPDETYCGNVAATSIKVFFALSALYGLILRGGDLDEAYLITPGSKDYMLSMATPDGIIAPKGMVLQVLGNLYGLPSSGRNFSKAVDAIVLKLAYKRIPLCQQMWRSTPAKIIAVKHY